MWRGAARGPARRAAGLGLLVLQLLAAAPAAGGEAGLGHKLAMLARGLCQMALSSEGRGARDLAREPDARLLEGWETETRTVVFVRHGESTWNEIFNRGTGLQRFLWMPLRLARGVATEAMVLLRPESTFIDSPLSHRGIQQAVAVREALRAAGDDHALLAEVLLAPGALPNATSVIVSSNLQRAVETITLALADRLADSGEPIYIRSELQEISRNLDAVALAPPLRYQPSPRTAVIKALDGADLDFAGLYCAEGNRGNKAVLGHPRHRLERFAAFCFGDPSVQGLPSLRSTRNATVIVAGHSLWFRTFFRMYIDKDVRHKAKDSKLSNAGVVSFTLERAALGGRMVYRIPPDSIRLLHGHFL